MIVPCHDPVDIHFPECPVVIPRRLTQDVVEEVAVVLIRVETVLNGGGETRVDVAVVQLAVQGQEDLV